MEILQGFVDAVVGIFEDSGLLTLNWQNYVMIGISIVLLYLAIKKQYEPLLLLPIAFGMLLVNLYPSIMAPPTTQLLTEAQCTAQNIAVSGHAKTVIDGVTYIENPTYGGLLYYLYQGVKLGIYPPLIFLGIGCMTDFGPLISNPKSLILGAAAQIGIFLTFTGAIFLGFTEAEAGAIGISIFDGRYGFGLYCTGSICYRYYRRCRRSYGYLCNNKTCSASSRFNRNCRIFIYGSCADYSAAYYEGAHNQKRAFGSYGTASSRFKA